VTPHRRADWARERGSPRGNPAAPNLSPGDPPGANPNPSRSWSPRANASPVSDEFTPTKECWDRPKAFVGNSCTYSRGEWLGGIHTRSGLIAPSLPIASSMVPRNSDTFERLQDQFWPRPIFDFGYPALPLSSPKNLGGGKGREKIPGVRGGLQLGAFYSPWSTRPAVGPVPGMAGRSMLPPRGDARCCEGSLQVLLLGPVPDRNSPPCGAIDSRLLSRVRQGHHIPTSSPGDWRECNAQRLRERPSPVQGLRTVPGVLERSCCSTTPDGANRKLGFHCPPAFHSTRRDDPQQVTKTGRLIIRGCDFLPSRIGKRAEEVRLPSGYVRRARRQPDSN
jgi:hypothetical protein